MSLPTAAAGSRFSVARKVNKFFFRGQDYAISLSGLWWLQLTQEEKIPTLGEFYLFLPRLFGGSLGGRSGFSTGTSDLKA